MGLRKEIIIYTDGACSGNPGPGGWAAVLVWGQKKKEISGFEKDTTNNRMELKAVIEGLRAIKDRSHPVRIVTDSEYIYNAFTKGWLDSWVNRGWKLKDKSPVKNQDLWEELVDLVDGIQINWGWTKGHASDPLNNRCDELARNEIIKNEHPSL